jgi:hypothetical protein
MTIAVRIDQANTVVELFSSDKAGLEGQFPDAFIETLLDAPDDTPLHYIWDGENYNPPPEPETPSLEDTLKLYAANIRAALIMSGTVVPVGNTNIPVWTDVNSQTSLVGLVVGTTISPGLTTVWKGRDANFYPLDANGIITVALGVMTFIETAFSVEAYADGGISNGAITLTAQIDGLPWPDTGL